MLSYDHQTGNVTEDFNNYLAVKLLDEIEDDYIAFVFLVDPEESLERLEHQEEDNSELSGKLADDDIDVLDNMLTVYGDLDISCPHAYIYSGRSEEDTHLTIMSVLELIYQTR